LVSLETRRAPVEILQHWLKSAAVSADEGGAMTTEQAIKILRRVEPSTAVRAHLATLQSNPTEAELAEVVEFLRAERLLRD
jgi:hypothetical protein